MTNHLVYKTTNLVNGKYYIGVHSCNCKSCSYLGSGTALKAAIRKYGRENFKRHTLKVFPCRNSALKYEEEIVLFSDRNSYNLCSGGVGGVGKLTKAVKLFGKEYLSIKEAAQDLKVTDSTISKWVRGTRKPFANSGHKNLKSVIFRGQIFPSINSLATKLSVSRYIINYRLNSSNYPEFSYNEAPF